jgi:hypothetical protein
VLLDDGGYVDKSMQTFAVEDVGSIMPDCKTDKWLRPERVVDETALARDEITVACVARW